MAAEKEAKKISAFRVKTRPIVLPGVEGRITHETGPFIVPRDSSCAASLVAMAQQGTLEILEAPESEVKILGEGTRVPRDSVKEASPIKLG